MPRRAAVVLFALLPQLARAETVQPVSQAMPTPGEDETLYSCKQRVGQVAVTFKPETDLKDLVTWVMGFTCKNFVLDPRITSTNKKVTIIAPAKMSPTEAYRVFLVALSTIGLTVVPKGNVLRIVESERARHDTVPIVKGVDDADQIVRYVLRPTYAQAETLKQAFTSIKSDAGDVAVMGSMVMITDFASHIREMLTLAKLVDVPGGTEGIYTIPVHHGDATKISQMLTSIFVTPSAPPAGAAKPADTTAEHAPSKILVDERTNTIVVAGTEAAYQRAKALVDRVDIALEMDGGSGMHVYQLTSAIADEVAQTLTKAVDTSGRSATAKPPTGAPPAPTATPTDSLGATIQGQVRVVADKPSNKLIITSSGRDFIAIRDVIRELDVPRRQVFIEMVILEVQLKDGTTIGTSSHGTLPVGGGGLAVGGVQAPSLKSMDLTTLASATGMIGGLLGPLKESSILGQSIPSYGVLFQALADHSSTNVISSTSQTALDNEDSKYSVGEDIPYTRGTLPVSPTATTQTISNIDRKPLALQLTIKPHISANDMVLLEVTHKSEDLTGRDAVLNEPIWATRNIETRTVVHDQQTVVIGGLIQEREIHTATKVPLLGDIPLLGYLFKYATKEKRKTNLVILLTPYIIKDNLDVQAIRERKVREYDEFARSFSSLNDAKFVPDVDYRKKRGLIEEINQSVLSVEADLAARASLHEPASVAPGPIEVH